MLPSAPTDSPSRTLTSPRGTDALKNLENAVGGRNNLIDTLVLAELDPKQQHFLRMLCDPTRVRDSLARICRDAGMKPGDLIELYRKASVAKAIAVSTGIAATAAPDIIRDLVAKSADRLVQCSSCAGTGSVTVGPAASRSTLVCGTCAGKGQVLKESDPDRQKTLLDMLGLGRKSGPGVSITQNNNQINANGVGSLFSSFVKSTDAAAYDVNSPKVAKNAGSAPSEVLEGESVPS